MQIFHILISSSIIFFYVKQTMKTIFKIGSKIYKLKYQRKMSEGEVKKMKSFVTEKGEKLNKTSKFKIIDIQDSKDQKTYKLIL